MSFDPRTLLILKYRGRSLAVFRGQCLRHEDLLSVARRTFPSLQDVPTSDIVPMAPIPEYPHSEPVELLPEIWTTICHVVDIVTIVLESDMLSVGDDTTACNSPVSSVTHLPATTPSSSSPPVQSRTQQTVLQTLNISFPTGSAAAPITISEPGLLRKKVSRFYELVDPKLGLEASNCFLSFGNSRLENERIFSDYGIISGSTILAWRRLRGGKPVIYIYPPSGLADVTVELALTSSWRFSAVHPPPQTTVPAGEPHTAQSLTWTVSAEPDGTLVDKTSGMEVSYLYWEAIANAQLMTPVASRSTTPIANTETFDPARPSVNPGNSVLLPISKVPGYLDAVLKALALHTEARTSFITYWLPDMLKHEYVALRFIAQDVYERAASLRIAPAPDIVTRVFMLFCGVAVGDLGLWEAAITRADGADGKFWADVVGVDATRAADSGLFRVLEWGGMEVQ